MKDINAIVENLRGNQIMAIMILPEWGLQKGETQKDEIEIFRHNSEDCEIQKVKYGESTAIDDAVDYLMANKNDLLNVLREPYEIM